MALSLDWGHPSHPSASETVAVSSSDGRLSVIKVKTQENHQWILLVTWFLAVDFHDEYAMDTSVNLFLFSAGRGCRLTGRGKLGGA